MVLGQLAFASHPARIRLYDSAAHRHGVELDVFTLLALWMPEDLLERAILGPAVHAAWITCRLPNLPAIFTICGRAWQHPGQC